MILVLLEEIYLMIYQTQVQFPTSFSRVKDSSGNGQLIPASDYDYLKVNLGSNEGLAAELSFDVRDDFDISLLDSSGNYLDTSWHSNPEYVTTNGSGYFGTVYIEIMSHTHQPPIYDENYTITIWKFTYQSGQTQNDIATGADLPNSITGHEYT